MLCCLGFCMLLLRLLLLLVIDDSDPCMQASAGLYISRKQQRAGIEKQCYGKS